MANKLYEESDIQAIATAIRSKNGSSDTYTVSQMRAAITAIPTGASNFIDGTFTVPLNRTGTTQTVSLPYTGSGYPIAAIVIVEGYGDSGDQNWSSFHSQIHRYALSYWVMLKSTYNLPPSDRYTYSSYNGGNIWVQHKDSTTSSTNSMQRTKITNIFLDAPTSDYSTAVAFTRTVPVQLKYIVSDTSYGLLEGITYRYMIVYSS